MTGVQTCALPISELFRPKKRRRSDAEIAKDLLARAKKAGMTSKDIAEKLGLEME